MIVNRGEIVHVVTRRLFDGDLRRHFVGKVEEAEGCVARLKGYTFVYDEATNQFVRRAGARHESRTARCHGIW